ncbi:MAG: hypothetical protein ACREQ9_18875, partial [Candidatus Binatia bacterium]
VGTGWWACEPPYFGAADGERCLLAAEPRKVYVDETDFVAGSAASAGETATGDLALLGVPLGESSFLGCCDNQGGVALEATGAPGCAAGWLLCNNGATSATCSC